MSGVDFAKKASEQVEWGQIASPKPIKAMGDILDDKIALLGVKIEDVQKERIYLSLTDDDKALLQNLIAAINGLREAIEK